MPQATAASREVEIAVVIDPMDHDASARAEPLRTPRSAVKVASWAVKRGADEATSDDLYAILSSCQSTTPGDRRIRYWSILIDSATRARLFEHKRKLKEKGLRASQLEMRNIASAAAFFCLNDKVSASTGMPVGTAIPKRVYQEISEKEFASLLVRIEGMRRFFARRTGVIGREHEPLSVADWSDSKSPDGWFRVPVDEGVYKSHRMHSRMVVADGKDTSARLRNTKEKRLSGAEVDKLLLEVRSTLSE